MDRNFARALSLVLISEGGWSDNPADPGGATMKGVTLATFRRFVKANATKDDLRRITDDQLAAVYRRQFWDAVRGDDLPDGVDYAVFDFAVNSGPDRAAKYLQDVAGVTQDGKVGPATLAAVRGMDAASTAYLLCTDRLAYLKRIKDDKGDLLWVTFGKGWESRVNAVMTAAHTMAIAARPKPADAPSAPPALIPAPRPITLPATAPEAAAGPVYYLDTEFNGLGGELLSLALVSEGDSSLYLVVPEPSAALDPWVAQNVWPLVANAPTIIKTAPLADWPVLIGYFLSATPGKPTIIADWPDDIRYLCGALISGPGTMAFAGELLFDVRRVDAYPTDLPGAVQHNAWWDAMALRHHLAA